MEASESIKFKKSFFYLDEKQLASLLTKLRYSYQKDKSVQWEVTPGLSDSHDWDGSYTLTVYVDSYHIKNSDVKEDYDFAMKLIDRALGE